MTYPVEDSIFGPIFSGEVLTQATLVTLKEWFPTYIHEIELQRGWTPKQIPPPRTYVERWHFDTYPDEQLPIVVAVCPGMAEPPRTDGDGTMSGWWSLGIGVIAAANVEKNSERMAKVYGAAARAIIEQKSYLDNSWDFDGVQVLDESYQDVPDMEQSRTMRSAQVVCRIHVMNIMNRFAGPAYPDVPDPSQPGAIWPDVQEVFIDIERLEEE